MLTQQASDQDLRSNQSLNIQGSIAIPENAIVPPAASQIIPITPQHRPYQIVVPIDLNKTRLSGEFKS